MRKSKKGLSAIVATLLIILLTLVAVGIIWIVIRNVVQDSTQQVDIDSMCLRASVEATSVKATDSVYTVTFTRMGGDEPIGGIKLVFSNQTGSENQVVDWELTGTGDNAPLVALASRTITLPVEFEAGPAQIGNLSGSFKPNKVSVVVYFLDSSGKKQLCSTANQLTFQPVA